VVKDAGWAALERRLGYRFGNRSLLIRALTHRSFSTEHNERLEFLGDSVLGLVVADLLFKKLDHGAEGDLSRLRAQLVREESLHGLARDLDLSRLLRLGEGEAHAGGRERASILADALEAVIGAVYLDGGFGAAAGVVTRLYRDVEITPALMVAAKDPKTTLQEWLQARKHKLPEYDVVRVGGAAHEQIFEVSCRVAALGGETHGTGSTRRAAEQQAAAAMVAWVGQKRNG
jgi:ribonuclease-3